MKSCPVCHRTYADDTFTFCLNDGALLSAPYNPQAPQQAPYYRPDPPPTEVMRQPPASAPEPLAPTMPAIALETAPQREQRTGGALEAESSEGMSPGTIATVVVLILIALVLGLLLMRC